MTASTVAFSRSVTIRASMRGHTKRSNVLDDSGLIPPNSQGEPDGIDGMRNRMRENAGRVNSHALKRSAFKSKQKHDYGVLQKR